MRTKLLLAASAALLTLNASAHDVGDGRVNVVGAQPKHVPLQSMAFDRVQGDYELADGRVLSVTGKGKGKERKLYADLCDGPVEILQLWLNLPSRLKMSEPAYTGLQRADIPELSLDGGEVALDLIAGEYEGKSGPVRSLTGVFMSTLRMRAGGTFRIDGLEDRSVFLYVARGVVQVGNHADLVSPMHLVELDETGDAVAIRAERDALVVLGHAAPIREPVVAHGPFVMTTREEITQAILDYQAGRFGAALG